MNAIDLYRLGRRLRGAGLPVLPAIIERSIFLLCNCVVPLSAEIGAESKLAYFGIGVVIHSRARIGRRVIIGQNVTIGRQLDPEGVPVIGDNVFIGPGARILGPISVGDNVIIGANSVVIRDVPANSVVAGTLVLFKHKAATEIYTLLKNIYPLNTCNFGAASNAPAS